MKERIRGCGMNLNELGLASGVAPPQLSRFMRGERTLTLPTVEKVCRVLNLELAERPAEKKKGGK
ncbi:MAG TPA: helix-turn-helix transcriptional regulator [Gemmataceae bacterium]|nr:helix-turn-helix transcriptional regulator [Gemmataceae bacterium]